MSKPVIGLTMYREPASWSGWLAREADLLTSTYAKSVIAAGGIPVLLPAVFDAETAAEVVGRIDGLIISGGSDVGPERYNESRHETVKTVYENRDDSELALLDATAAVGMPLLGICRGMQLMAVHAGGSLNQHIPEQLGHIRHSPAPNEFGKTPVKVAAGHLISGISDADMTVPCHHHQTVKAAPGYTITSWSVDETPESMERPGERFELGVQWHPEQSTDVRLFEAVVAAAGEFAQTRAVRSQSGVSV